MQKISNPLKETMNNMAMQFISFALTIVIAYILTNLILLIIKVPAAFRKFIALIVALIVMYYSYNKIFL